LAGRFSDGFRGRKVKPPAALDNARPRPTMSPGGATIDGLSCCWRSCPQPCPPKSPSCAPAAGNDRANSVRQTADGAMCSRGHSVLWRRRW
jgi:hypothetical protein